MDKFADFIEEIIKKNWPWVVVLALGYFGWRYNLEKDVLAIAGTIVLGIIAWKLWVHYVRQSFISGIDYVLLEIVPPRNVERNPAAMELFISNALFQFSNKGGGEEYWQGAVWFWFSLEIVSIEGQVHFYIRTPTRVRRLIETQMYAQYPQAQVKEVEDYTLSVDKITPDSAWMGWGCEWELLKPEAYPIKTYVNYSLDKDPDEELKLDPISPVIELFGAIGRGEQLWLQIVVTPSKKRYNTHEGFLGYHDWVQQARLEIDKLLLPYTSKRDEQDTGKIIKAARIEIRVPAFLDRVIKAMSAKTAKLGFDTGIRLMYVAKKENYSMETRRDIRLIFRQYQAPDANGLNRTNSTQADAFNTSFFSLSPKQVMILADRMLLEYRERAFFHLPLRHMFNNHNITGIPSLIVKQFWLPYFHPPTYVLNTEELATLWHFPGQILKTPTLERVESKEASPPTNLPT